MKQKGTIAKRVSPKKVKAVIVNQDRTSCLVIKEEKVSGYVWPRFDGLPDREVKDPNQLLLF